MPRLVALDVGEDLGKHGLDPGIRQEAEDRLGRSLGQDLHGEELEFETSRAEEPAHCDPEVGIQLRDGHVEQRHIIA
jgi:hypothetical protein